MPKGCPGCHCRHITGHATRHALGSFITTQNLFTRYVHTSRSASIDFGVYSVGPCATTQHSWRPPGLGRPTPTHKCTLDNWQRSSRDPWQCCHRLWFANRTTATEWLHCYPQDSLRNYAALLMPIPHMLGASVQAYASPVPHHEANRSPRFHCG